MFLKGDPYGNEKNVVKLAKSAISIKRRRAVKSNIRIGINQKHLFHRERIIEKRIRSGNCVSCGKKLPDHDRYRTACGADQYKVCKECSRLTYLNSKYCRNRLRIFDRRGFVKNEQNRNRTVIVKKFSAERLA
jgi:hypothetical protein